MSLVTTAEAQWRPLDGRLLVSVNGGGQAGSQDIEARFSAPLYDETRETAVAQGISGGGLFDISAAMRLRGEFGVGLAFTRMGSSGSAALAGTVPHPLVGGGSPRPFTALASGLDHSQRAVHFQAVWFVPFTERIDFAFAAGPSFLSVQQEFARGVAFQEVPPGFDSIVVTSVERERRRRSGAGFNISGDATYTITQMIGAGVLLRYTRGGVDFDLGDGARVDIDAGNFQAAIGLRLRF